VQARIEEVTQTPAGPNGQSVYAIACIASKALLQVSRLLYMFSARARYNRLNSFPTDQCGCSPGDPPQYTAHFLYLFIPWGRIRLILCLGVVNSAGIKTQVCRSPWYIDFTFLRYILKVGQLDHMADLFNFSLFIHSLIFKTGSPYMAPAVLKLIILLPQPPEHWGYKPGPLGLAFIFIF
jgi:hypothetical protein